MLKKILSVSGRPGLFRMLSNAKNMAIVESLSDGKRFPVFSRDKVISLGEVAIYTTDEEKPLREVLVAIKEKEGGKPSSVAPQAPAPQLRAYLREVLPNFDEDKVYNTDIKKLLSWYNILIEHNIDFETVESPEEDTGDSAAETGGE